MPGSCNPRRGIHLGLADDGYLFLDQGEIFRVRIGFEFDPDWILPGRTIASLASRERLLVRYPVRMKEASVAQTSRPSSLRFFLSRGQRFSASRGYPLWFIKCGEFFPGRNREPNLE